MRAADVSKLFAYAVSLITVSGGGIVLSGFLISDAVPAQFRITIGVVLVLLGIYRFVVARLRAAHSARMEE